MRTAAERGASATRDACVATFCFVCMSLRPAAGNVELAPAHTYAAGAAAGTPAAIMDSLTLHICKRLRMTCASLSQLSEETINAVPSNNGKCVNSWLLTWGDDC